MRNTSTSGSSTRTRAENAEFGLLGAMLAQGVRPAGISSTHFSIPGLGIIFDAVVRVLDRGGSPDVASVSVELGDDGLDRAGGQVVLDTVACEHTSSLQNLLRYAEIVRASAGDRAISAACKKTLDTIESGSPSKRDAAFREMRRAIDEVAQPPAENSRSYDAGDLLESHMEDPRFIARPWITEGVTLVVGRPKIGKTTLLRQIAIAANTAGEALGAQHERANVLFLSLEEGERLMRAKLRAMGVQAEAVRGIRLEFEWPQGAAGVDRLRQWLKERPADGSPRLIVVDSLTRFRVPPSDRGHAFTEDYNAVRMLADLCKDFPGLAVLVLHHTTKAAPDDPVSCISGTYGLTAAADNYLILLKQAERFRLHAGGRLWLGDAGDFELTRAEGLWHLAGEWEFAPGNAALTPKQRRVIEALREGAKSSSQLMTITGQRASALSHLMAALKNKGLVSKLANGWEIVR